MPATEPPKGELAPGLMGTRAEAMQRLKVGAGGLLGVLFVVALASSVIQTTRGADDTPVATAQAGQTEAANDPLVDFGVAPELPGDDESIVGDLPPEQMPRASQAPSGE